MEIIASDTFGRSVNLTYQKIHQVLTNPCEGVAHVFAHDPKLICISRVKWHKEWEIAVEESWDNDPESSKMPIPTIYYVTFKDEDIDAAIKLFLNLVKSPRKEYEESMRQKIGKYIIFSNPGNDDIQIYTDETLRRSTKRGSSGRRQESVARKGKKINHDR
ncbi:MAG: hypothetical protein WC919_06860 [Candidatus Paceibacterota bacterium]|jgi:hypothetical protein